MRFAIIADIHGNLASLEAVLADIDQQQIDRIVDLYVSLGVDRLSAWTYRGGYGTVLAAPDALALWDRIGQNYRRVCKK